MNFEKYAEKGNRFIKDLQENLVARMTRKRQGAF